MRLLDRTRKPVAPSPICGFELSRSGELLAAVTPDGAPTELRGTGPAGRSLLLTYPGSTALPRLPEPLSFPLSLSISLLLPPLAPQATKWSWMPPAWQC